MLWLGVGFRLVRGLQRVDPVGDPRYSDEEGAAEAGSGKISAEKVQRTRAQRLEPAICPLLMVFVLNFTRFLFAVLFPSKPLLCSLAGLCLTKHRCTHHGANMTNAVIVVCNVCALSFPHAGSFCYGFIYSDGIVFFLSFCITLKKSKT